VTEHTAEEPIAIEAAPAVSQPVVNPPVVVGPAAKASHTRTILEVVGGVVAIGLLLFAAAAGFVLGHVTAKHDGRDGGHRGITMSVERGEGRMMPERGQGFQQEAPGLPGTAPTVPQQ